MLSSMLTGAAANNATIVSSQDDITPANLDVLTRLKQPAPCHPAQNLTTPDGSAEIMNWPLPFIYIQPQQID